MRSSRPLPTHTNHTMKTPFTFLALLMATTLALADDNADQGHVANKLKLTLAGAKKVGEADAKFAKNSGAGPSIAVVDDGGYLLYFVPPEESFAAGAKVSIGEARASAIFNKPTKDFEDTINKGRFTMTALPDFTPLQGGVPIVVDGQIVGAIGCSGAKSAAQDEEVARAGAAVLVDAKPVQ